MTRRNLRLAARAALIALGVGAAAGAQAQTVALYTPAGAIPLGAPERWDYVTFDPTSQRVYVAHGDRISVVDARTQAKIGEVVGTPGGSHGVAISTAAGHGYTDDGDAGTVKVFDLKTLQVVKTLKGSPDADGIARDPRTGRLFVLNGDSQTVTVVDPKTDTVVAEIPLGDKLEFGVADGAGKLYVDAVNTRSIVRVDIASNTVDGHFPIPDCESPHGLAMDPTTRRLFATCLNGKMMVVNADSGKLVADLPIGLGSDAAAFDPVRHRVFSSNGKDGTLTVIQQDGPDAYRVLGAVTTQRSARTMAIDPATGRLYIAAADLTKDVDANGRPKAAPGSLKLLMFDPAR